MKKKMVWITSILTLLFVLTGCTPNQQVLFDATMKMQKVNSVQEHTTMSFELSGSGFEPAVQQQIDSTAMLLNTAKLDLNVKTNGNEQKTVSQAQIDMNLDMQGLSLNVPLWVDMDLTGENPKLVEIIKVPAMATASFPSRFANKEYMVMNPYDMKDSELSNLDPTKLMEFSKNFQTKGVEFLTSYAQRFNPNLDVVNVPTNDGTQKFSIKLNDAQLKEFLSYTVNNFAQDKEAMDFIKEYLSSMIELGGVPDQAQSSIDLDQAIKELDASTPEFLAQFNGFMAQLENVSLLGDKGLEINYTISNGYVINESGLINFKVDLSQINSLMNTLSGQKAPAIDAKGVVNLTVNFNTDITGINTPISIQIPELNENNSFNYMDLIKVLAAPPRLAGLDRYQTARAISEDFNKGKCDNIILASGTNFPDALSASILSKKYNAPILLVGSTVGESSEAFDYIALHSTPATKVYIIGGTGVINDSFETEILKKGNTIERLSGLDLYETNMAVVNNANVKSGTPVIVASGEGFPDALSVSSFAGSNQYPTLLVGKDFLAEKTKDYILTQKPSTVYIAGGISVVSQSVEDQIKALVPGTAIKRLAGNDRFETAGAVVNEFATSPDTLYIANGYSFADALAGSGLAAKTGDPILLIDQNSGTFSPAIQSYLKQLRATGIRPTVRTLGGEGVVPASLVQQAQRILMGIE
ncbi:cell wall-binding repeat-containing protein [Desulfitobacterium metallireducens]|nr:cell wall-binding repeat-containing protein [Desulfitobacterium metallireducens]